MSYKSSYTGAQIDAAVAKANAIPASKTIVGTDSSGNIIDAAGSSPSFAAVTLGTASSRCISKTVAKGDTGGFATITLTFGGNNANGVQIAEIQMAAYGGVYLDYAVARYSAGALCVMRNNAAAGVSVSVTGADGTAMTVAVSHTSTIYNPAIKAVCTVGGYSSSFNTYPTITFA